MSTWTDRTLDAKATGKVNGRCLLFIRPIPEKMSAGLVSTEWCGIFWGSNQTVVCPKYGCGSGMVHDSCASTKFSNSNSSFLQRMHSITWHRISFGSRSNELRMIASVYSANSSSVRCADAFLIYPCRMSFRWYSCKTAKVSNQHLYSKMIFFRSICIPVLLPYLSEARRNEYSRVCYLPSRPLWPKCELQSPFLMYALIVSAIRAQRGKTPLGDHLKGKAR